MANAAQRQRTLAAKAARRKVVVAEKKKNTMMPLGLASRIRMAARGPIELCLIPLNLFETGIGNVVIARKLPSGLLGCGFFLVDAFCLGVKDAFYREMVESDLQSRIESMSEAQSFAHVPPARARSLIRQAIAYAAGLGLSAAKDTNAVEAIFGDVDPDDRGDEFTFGRDGKPFYVSGPYDSAARIRMITSTLDDHCGEGGWHYMIQVTPDL